MTRIAHAIVIVAASLLLSACQSKHQEGVKSDYRAQWLDVNASTTAATDAAEAVLEDEGLKDVQASSTNVDGKATAKKADGTKVDVSIKKKSEDKSQVSVVVGTIGQPALGADLARKIKERAEAGGMRNTNTGTMTSPR